MNSATVEQILCARAADLPPVWLPEAGSVRLSEVEWLARMDGVEPHWLPRHEAENNPAFKQWIPYILLQNARGELAAYPRQGTEARLHGLWSLGLGGHINPTDGAAPGAAQSAPWRDLLWNGMRRELGEEYPGAATAGTTRFLGLIHESRSAVGRVHIGAVFLHEITGDPGAPGAELAGLQWVSAGDVGGIQWPLERFELWSQLAVQLLTLRS